MSHKQSRRLDKPEGWSIAEAENILARAIQLQTDRVDQEQRLTLSQLMRIAEEVGIDFVDLEQALADAQGRSRERLITHRITGWTAMTGSAAVAAVIADSFIGGGFDEITFFGTFAVAVSLGFAARHFEWLRTRAARQRLA